MTTNDEQAKQAFAAHLRAVAEQVESGKLVDVVLVVPAGWTGVIKTPNLLQALLFDAMCALQQMGRAMMRAEQAREAPRIVVPPIGVGGVKLN